MERQVRHLLVLAARHRDRPDGDELAVGRTLDISPAGVRIALQSPLPVGSELDLTLQLGNDLRQVSATVVHCAPESNGLHVVGVELSGLSDADRSALTAHLEQQPGSGRDGDQRDR